MTLLHVQFKKLTELQSISTSAWLFTFFKISADLSRLMTDFFTFTSDWGESFFYIIHTVNTLLNILSDQADKLVFAHRLLQNEQKF